MSKKAEYACILRPGKGVQSHTKMATSIPMAGATEAPCELEQSYGPSASAGCTVAAELLKNRLTDPQPESGARLSTRTTWAQTRSR